MKNRVLIVLLAAVLCLGGVACGQGTTDGGTDTNQEEQKDKDVDNDQQNQDKEKEPPDADHTDGKKEEETKDNPQPEEPEDKTEPVEQQKQVTVYYSDPDANGFETTDVTIAQLTPEAIVAVLSTKGVLPADVQVNSFKTAESDGDKIIDLDLSAGFGTYLRGMGTAGEYIVMGSICNTFLEAYDCQKIRITVDGEKVETGHAEYPGYLNKFQ